MGEWILPHRLNNNNSALEENHIKKSNKRFNIDQINYVVLDAAVWGNYIEELFLIPDIEYVSLFAIKGADRSLNAVAPYLLRINRQLNKWLENSERKIFRRLYIESDLSIEALRKHLRKFLRVKAEDGKWLYFRFYDPFVVSSIFPNLSQEQYSEFFKNIDYIIADDARVNERRIFYLSSEKILQTKHQTLDYVDNNR